MVPVVANERRPQWTKYSLVALLVLILPVLVLSTKLRQLVGSQASTANEITEVRIDPAGDVLAARAGSPVYLNTLAFANLTPLRFPDVLYEWGQSTTNVPGRLVPNRNTAVFYPGSGVGTGQLWVKATAQNSITRGLRVAVVDPWADDFAGTGDFDLSKWTYAMSPGMTVQRRAGQLSVDIPAGPTQEGNAKTGTFSPKSDAVNQLNVTGDFDAQVELFALPKNATGASSYLGFGPVMIRRTVGIENGKIEQFIETWARWTRGGNLEKVSSYKLIGQADRPSVRLVRAGTTFSTWVNPYGGGWELQARLMQIDDAELPSNARVGAGNAAPNFTGLTAAFDKYSVLISPFALQSSPSATGAINPTPIQPTSFPTSAVASPTPLPNQAPIIVTTSLNVAGIGVPYMSIITVTDANAGDTLSVTINNLPPGITRGPCGGGR